MKQYIKANQKAYDALASEYKQRIVHYQTEVGVDLGHIAKPFIKELKKNFKNIHVLELGPGAGLSLAYFEKEGFQTTAIELSENMIKTSKEIAKTTSYIHGDFLEHNFRNKKFEGIFAHAFIHLFPKKDAEKAITKTVSLLKTRGILFIATTKHTKSEEGYFSKDDYATNITRRFRRKWTEEELLELFKRNSLAIIHKGELKEKQNNKMWLHYVLQLQK